jgi:D-alanyl-D-alanine dipeptidase
MNGNMIVPLLSDLRNRPIPEPNSDLYSSYVANKTQYWREVIPNIPVTQTDRLTEPLSDCSKFGVRFKNYYAGVKPLKDAEGSIIHVGSRVLLRDSILSTLRKLNEALTPARLSVVVMSGFRSRQLQSLIIANAAKERGDIFASGHFAFPEDYLPHATGAALDIEMWDEHYNRIVPTKWTDTVDKYAIEKAHNLSTEEEMVRGNRRIIHHLLTDSLVLAAPELFVAHPREYWHYGRHERLSAFFGECYGFRHHVFYDELPDDNAVGSEFTLGDSDSACS